MIHLGIQPLPFHFLSSARPRSIVAAHHAALGDDRGDQPGRGDVEGGVAHRDALGGELLAADVGDLGGVALLDGDVAAVGQGRGRWWRVGAAT